MMNRKQNKLFNKLMSDSKSFLHTTEGKDVAVFKSEGNLLKALEENGFNQTINKDKFGNYSGHSIWWNETLELLVLNNPGSNLFTVATEDTPVLSSVFSE